MNTAGKRESSQERVTKETSVKITLSIDGTSQIKVKTGIGFFDHLLTTLAFYAGWDFEITAVGDTNVDDHHTVEDCALVIGAAFDEALGDRSGIARFGYAYAPHDESLARAVVDLSNRPYAGIDLNLQRESIGELACENIPHFLESLAYSAKFTLHLDMLRGSNDHHRAEAAFKALGLALAIATSRNNIEKIQSTKGAI